MMCLANMGIIIVMLVNFNANDSGLLRWTPLKGPNMARGGVNSLFKNSTNSLEQEVSK